MKVALLAAAAIGFSVTFDDGKVCRFEPGDAAQELPDEQGQALLNLSNPEAQEDPSDKSSEGAGGSKDRPKVAKKGGDS